MMMTRKRKTTVDMIACIAIVLVSLNLTRSVSLFHDEIAVYYTDRPVLVQYVA